MLQCVMIPGCGRIVQAAHDLMPGEVIFREEAYVVCPNYVTWKSNICVYCSAHMQRPTHECGDCGAAYCSGRCSELYNEQHRLEGECAVLAFTKAARAQVPAEDFETFQILCLVIDKCAREKKQDRLLRTAPPLQDFETVGMGQQQVSPFEFVSSSTPEKVMVPSYDHVECLATNLSDTDPEVTADFHALYDCYTKLLRKKKLQSLLSKTLLTEEVSRDVFVSLCAAFLCNGFGIWDGKGRKKAVAIYPESSFFNHNCAPNLGRRNIQGGRTMEFFTTRSVKAGEQLCISYVDIKFTVRDRKAHLKGTYSFDCSCSRCQATGDEENALCSSDVPALCDTCRSKVLQPISDNKYICPCCDRIQVAL